MKTIKDHARLESLCLFAAVAGVFLLLPAGALADDSWEQRFFRQLDKRLAEDLSPRNHLLVGGDDFTSGRKLMIYFGDDLTKNPHPKWQAQIDVYSLLRERDNALFEKTISARPDPKVFHVYLGYAGWTPDQLRTEVQMGAWFIFPADTATIFSADPGSVWLQMIHKTKLQLAKTEPFVGLY